MIGGESGMIGGESGMIGGKSRDDWREEWG